MKLHWTGPHRWPTRKSPLPEWPGIYLWTFEHQDGFIVYVAGITRRPLTKRFQEHTRAFLKGTYTLFDLDALTAGQRSEVWHGFWTKKHPPAKLAEYERRRDELQRLAHAHMGACRIFAAKFSTERRLLERLEAAIMNQLYNAPQPFCDIPDRGMMLAPRWKSETPIEIVATFPVLLYGLRSTFVI